MMRLRMLCFSIAFIGAAQAGMAQGVRDQPPLEQRPVERGTVVLSEFEGTVVWRADDGVPFTLATLVQYVAPIVWFSPDEPLLRAGARLPQPLPPLNAMYPVNPPSRVYYTIPMLQLHNTAQCAPLVDTKTYDPRKHPLDDEQLQWNDAQQAPVSLGSPPLDCLDLVRIRFFFYYASEVGVSAHSNDFESLQVNVRIKANLPKGDDSTECATATPTTGHCAIVSGVFGSAHGIAWYTNGLNVDKNRDTLLPIGVLVEEGKHASAPDRNADGAYTPGFDVDIHPNDAWGIRDVLRTRWLQGPAFRSDMAKRRLDRDRVFPPAPNARIMNTWLERTGYPDDGWQNTYTLENMRKAAGVDDDGQPALYCDPASDRLSATFRNKRPRPGCNGGACEPLEALVRGEEGCRRTRVLPFKGWQKMRYGLSKANIGGTHDEYLTWPRFFAERIAPGVRISGTARSGWWIPPVAWNVPGFDGWVSTRWNFLRHADDNGLLESPVDVLYSISAARYFSSYVAVGRDTLPLDDSRAPAGHRVALEGGFKWRLSIPKVGVFTGVRVGLRADDPPHLRHPRVIVEAGGGSW